MINLVKRAKQYKSRIAIKADSLDYTYADLFEKSKSVALHLLNGKSDLHGKRIAFIVDPGFDYVTIQWGVWIAGGIAVPLCVSHPLPSIEYVLGDAQVSIVIYGKTYSQLLNPLLQNSSINFINVSEITYREGSLPDIEIHRDAMILYTSGTTSKPKGVVTTHFNIEHQIKSLVQSWHWSKDDHILNVLPLHHVHGIINVVSCALWSGATCEFLPKFSEKEVFEIFLKGKVNVFMAVPTIYYKLIAYWKNLPGDEQKLITEKLKPFRLMVSGSAALPITVMEQWERISGHILLERYGMTEIGMAISNSYEGERIPGHIGRPLEGVDVRLVNEKMQQVADGQQGEIQIKGNTVFKNYWNKPDQTTKAFTKDGWFKTGDIAIKKNGIFRILGRSSVDIIKSGGYKISALEIEEVLRKHPDVDECAVVGIADPEWGELIAAAIISKNQTPEIDEIKSWMRQHLPGYKIPRLFVWMDSLPRNVMGKVTKNELKLLLKNP